MLALTSLPGQDVLRLHATSLAERGSNTTRIPVNAKLMNRAAPGLPAGTRTLIPLEWQGLRLCYLQHG